MSKVRHAFAVYGSEDGVLLATASLRKALNCARNYTESKTVYGPESREFHNERQINRYLDDGETYMTFAVFHLESANGDSRAEIHVYSEE